jgi:hypothetical protein
MPLHSVSITLPQSSITSQSLVLADGASVAGIKFSVAGTGADANVLTPQIVTGPAPYRANFADVAEGSYVATFQAVDSLGNALGGAVTQSFTVAPGVTNVDVPTGLATITVA